MTLSPAPTFKAMILPGMGAVMRTGPVAARAGIGRAAAAVGVIEAPRDVPADAAAEHVGEPRPAPRP